LKDTTITAATGYGLNNAVSDVAVNAVNLIYNGAAKNPDKIVVILSVTPLVAGQQNGSMNNDVIASANDTLLEFAKERNLKICRLTATVI